ncbi:MAG: YdcF family protein [Hyphomicrobiales bacterium]
MFFYVAKIGWFLAQPSNLLGLMLVLGTLLLWTGWARTGRRLVALSAVLYMALGLSPLGHALVLPLEDRFPRPRLDDADPPDGIILLGGAQDMLVSAARNAPSTNEAGERYIETMMLARRFPDARVVFSGGAATLVYEAGTESSGARQVLEGMGLEPGRLETEAKSRDTWENARFTHGMIRPEPGSKWLLVTSASHMPRAMGSFRKAGFEVIPWPVDYRTRGGEDLARFFSRPSEGLRRIDWAVREWAGLLVYRLAGRSDAFFPAP